MKSSKITRYPLSIIVIVAIWTVCMLPMPETPLDNVSLIDKWTHFVMYGVLTAVIWMEYALCHITVSWLRLLCFGLLLPVLMGCSVEFAQAYLTTYRSGDWLDAVCNALGVLLGALVGCGVLFYRLRR